MLRAEWVLGEERSKAQRQTMLKRCSGEGRQGPGMFQLPVLGSRSVLVYMETCINSPLLYFGPKRQKFSLSSDHMRFPVLQDPSTFAHLYEGDEAHRKSWQDYTLVNLSLDLPGVTGCPFSFRCCFPTVRNGHLLIASGKLLLRTHPCQCRVQKHPS